jgi:hypothetical protein
VGDRDITLFAQGEALTISANEKSAPSRIGIMTEGVTMPIHQITLVALGIRLFENCDLEAVASAAAERKRWSFLVTAAPLAIPGGTGSPLNPIAVF